MENTKKNRFSGYGVAIGCAIIMFCHFGCLSIIAVMTPHFLQRFGCPLTAIQGSSSVGTLSGALILLTVGPVLKKLKPRGAMVVATLAYLIFLSINAFAYAPWMLYVSNVVGGFMIAYGTHVTCTAVINRWFIAKRSTVIGLVVGGSAFGGALYMYLAGNMVGRIGQTKTYLILAIVPAVICFLCELFLIRNDPEDVGQKPLGWENAKAETTARTEDDGKALTPGEARRIPAFWMMLIAIFLGTMLLNGFTSFAATFWTSKGVAAASAATYSSIYALLGGIVSMVAGAVADKRGLKSYLFLIFGCYFIGISMAILWGTIAPFLLVLVLNIIFVSAGNPIQGVSSVMTLPVFGPKAADSINGALVSASNFGFAVSSVAFGAIYDLTGSFIPMFGLLLVMSVIVLTLLLLSLGSGRKARME